MSMISEYVSKIKNLNKPKKLDCFFETNKGQTIQLNKLQCIERIAHFLLFLFILVICYNCCNWLGEKLTDSIFDKQYMYSIFLIPLFLYIKDFNNIFDACFAEAIYCEEYITVKKGLFYRSYDKLYIKDINNIELYRSLGGKLCGYCTLNFYAIGGLVQIPYVMDNIHNAKIIKQIINFTEQNQKIEQNQI